MVNLASGTRLDLVETESTPISKRQKYLKLADWIVESISLHDPRAKQWVRVPLSLLDHPDFEGLPDATKYHLIGLMLLVRRVGFNHLPNNERYLRDKIGAKTEINLELLRSKHFLIASKRKRTKDGAATDKCAAIRQDRIRVDKTQHDTEPDAKGACMCSKFSYEQCLAYADSLTAKGIHNAGGYARAIQRSGEADAQIERFIHPDPTPSPTPTLKQPDPNCPKCLGAGMEVVKGKGARRCDCLEKGGGA
jgi:hypothetical protein